MTALFAAVRTLVVATLFVWLWAAVGLWVRQFDPLFGGLLPSWTWPIGIAFAAAGAALALTCMGLFAIRGKGTPAPFDPPRTFVAFGPYRAVRNPMYVGAWLTIVGCALIARSSSWIERRTLTDFTKPRSSMIASRITTPFTCAVCAIDG